MTFDRILVPVDFSPDSRDAALIAASIAGTDSEVMLLHVDPVPGVAVLSAEPLYLSPELMSSLRSRHDAKVDSKLSELHARVEAERPGVDLRITRRMNDVVGGIIDYASEWDADLIVIGSSGLTGAARFILGSTSEKVSRGAPCPVLVTRPPDLGRELPRQFERALVAVDYSRFSAPLARLAARVVGPEGSLELAHVWYPPYLSALNFSLGGREGDLAAAIESGRATQGEMLSEFASDLGKLPVAKVDRYVASGNPAHALLERAEETHADLLCIGAHSREGVTERIIGTHADRILRHATIPVLLLPEAAL